MKFIMDIKSEGVKSISSQVGYNRLGVVRRRRMRGFPLTEGSRGLVPLMERRGVNGLLRHLVRPKG